MLMQTGPFIGLELAKWAGPSTRGIRPSLPFQHQDHEHPLAPHLASSNCGFLVSDAGPPACSARLWVSSAKDVGFRWERDVCSSEIQVEAWQALAGGHGGHSSHCPVVDEMEGRQPGSFFDLRTRVAFRKLDGRGSGVIQWE